MILIDCSGGWATKASSRNGNQSPRCNEKLRIDSKIFISFFSLYIIYRQEKVFLKEKLPCSQPSRVSMTVSLLITAVLPFQVVRQQSQMLVYLIVTHEYHERLVEILDHNRFLHQDRIHDEVYRYDRRYPLSLHV